MHSALGPLLTLSLLLGLSAFAAGGPLETGVKAYERGDYTAAVKLLQRASASPSAARGERAKALLYLAAAHFALGESISTDRALEPMLRENPDAEAGADIFPPPFIIQLEKVRAQVKAQADEVPQVAATPTDLVLTPIPRVEPAPELVAPPTPWVEEPVFWVVSGAAAAAVITVVLVLALPRDPQPTLGSVQGN